MKQRLIGLISTATILAVVVGLPAVLLAVGNPLPASLPSLDELRSNLTSADDGALALSVITVVGWVCWLVLTGSVLLEVGARVRGRAQAPQLRGLAVPQSMARGLVTGALMLVASGSGITAASAVPHLALASVSASAATADASASQQQESRAGAAQHSKRTEEKGAPRATSVTVKAGDSLWALAERHLGEGREFTQILELNRDVLGNNSSMLTPGTVLQIPTPATNTQVATQTTQVTVATDDTLSGIAQDELGSTQHYREIFDANRDQVSDPDHIEPGWVLDVPEESAASTAAVRDSKPSVQEPVSGGQDAHQSSEAARAAASDAQRTQPKAATPTQSSSETAEPKAPAPEVTSEASQDGASSAWTVAGLAGAGAVLGGSLFLKRRILRQRALRARRPGRTIVAPSPQLQDLDRTISHARARTAVTVEWMDQALRRLAAAIPDGQQLPVVAAVELSAEDLTLYLEEPMPPHGPWQGSEDAKRWVLTAETDLDEVGPYVPDQEAPWPMLVTIGRRDDRTWWLLNIEDLSLVVVGDVERADSLARYVAAEIAVNAWSQHARVHLMGVGSELEGLSPERMVTYADWDEEAGTQILLETIECIDRADDLGDETATLRAKGVGADVWPARAVIVYGGQGSEALTQLEQTVRAGASRSGTGVIRVNPTNVGEGAMVVEVGADGRVRIPHAGLEIEGVGLTVDEARACAQLAAEYRRQEEAPIPAIEHPSQPWQTWSNAAGAMREEHTLERETPAEEQAPTVSVLDETDAVYLEAAATTAQDLAVLSPQVEQNTATQVQEEDPALDEDVAAWWAKDCILPRVTFLGPVNVRPVAGTPVTERKAYWTEVVSYLALHPHGATNAELQDAFDVSQGRVRTVVNQAREWLGINPRSGQKHIPDARQGPAARARGISAYELVDVLVDADLFRRLRLRGQARGKDGVGDLLAALSMVQAPPFSQLRPHGWSWLTEGERIDEVLTLAIVDTAHLATTACLRAGDLHNARMATMTALRAAPYEDIPKLDMARITEAEGDEAAADDLIRDEICNVTDTEGGSPLDLSERTQQVLDERSWSRARRAS